MRQAADFYGLLEVLATHGVDFVVVGGVSAVLHGAPVTTYDLDVVHDQAPENVERLLKALASLQATFRSHPHVIPSAEHFTQNRHNLMMSRLGPVDFLGAIGEGVTYADLLPRSEVVSLGSLPVQVMTLAALVDHKRALGRDKDKWILAILQRTLEERDRG